MTLARLTPINSGRIAAWHFSEMHLPVVAITIGSISVTDRSGTVQRSAWPDVSIGCR